MRISQFCTVVKEKLTAKNVKIAAVAGAFPHHDIQKYKDRRMQDGSRCRADE